MNNIIIEVNQLKKDFQVGDVTVRALKGIDIVIQKGEFVAIMGTSGSGKSTMLNILGCLDKPTSGEYKLDGVSISGLNLPSQLSGGQQQRVAIARSLVNDPVVILADEATGNLDTRTSYEIMELFQRLNSDQGKTIVFVTHEPDIARLTSRNIVFRDGWVLREQLVDDRLLASDMLRSLPLDDHDFKIMKP